MSAVAGISLPMNLDLPALAAASTPPVYLSGKSAWVEHIPFAFTAMMLLRPRVFVELGTHFGDSYCAFCQAVEKQQLETRCFAIDSWQGDKHAGFYGEEVLVQVRQAHDGPYQRFSDLLQTNFDEASCKFPPASIDLLHIDGLHTYEAVKHDFETWSPLLSDRAVVLFHDTEVRREDFGVWQLWDELKSTYPSFSFFHGYGLGVLGVGSEVPTAFQSLFSCSPEEAGYIRDFFSGLGGSLSRVASITSIEAKHHQTSRDSAHVSQAVAEMEAALAQCDRARAAAETALAAAESRILQLQPELDDARAELALIKNSRSWRLTRPLRRR